MTAVVRPCLAAEAEARLPELGALLADAVARGASVNFMAGFTAAEGEAFWRGQLPGLRAGEKRLLVAEAAGRLVGTVVLSFAPQPNGPHRAEIGKMLVHSAHRRQGLGRRLLEAAKARRGTPGARCCCWTRRPAARGPACMRPAAGRHVAWCRIIPTRRMGAWPLPHTFSRCWDRTAAPGMPHDGRRAGARPQWRAAAGRRGPGRSVLAAMVLGPGRASGPGPCRARWR